MSPARSASLAWLASRRADRWHFLLVGALVLLGWNPYTLLDAGFQLSFAAVVAIFVLVPRLEHVLEGYPLRPPPAHCRCGLRCVRARDRADPLASVPCVPLLTRSRQRARRACGRPVARPRARVGAVDPFSGRAPPALAWVNGWWAAYLVASRALVGGLPFAQIRSTSALLASSRGCSWSRPMLAVDGDRAQARLPAHRRRPAEDQRALRRLRDRIGDDAVEHLAAETASGEEAVAACNSLGLLGGGDRLVIVEGVESWKAADVKAVAAYLEALRRTPCWRSSPAT